VYGRTIETGESGEGPRELTFEASGALLEASLVMRDRETDSWWSIMTSDAIGGPLEGTGLDELPVSKKAPWGDWKRRHPETLVLSVRGEEHVDRNPYESYFASDGTFRDLEVADDRLPPKEPIYAFRLDGEPWAVAHAAIEGGALFRLPGEGDGAGERRVALHRPPGAALYASSRAWALEGEVSDPAALFRRMADGGAPPPGAESLDGFDTYWYTWVAVNQETGILTDTPTVPGGTDGTP
jgi:hypothetical protein